MKTQERITQYGVQLWPKPARTKQGRTKQGRFTSFKTWIKDGLRWIAIRAGIALAAFGLLTAGYFYHAVTAPNLNVINQLVKMDKTIPPVLHRIALAESGDKQYRDGQVVIHVNHDGTYDQGRYQVNSIWNKKASKMGLNLLEEKDNEAFAIWLFETYGSEPWSASKSVWNK